MKYKVTKYSLFILNIAIVVFSFLLVAKVRTGTRRILAPDSIYWRSLLPFIMIWIGAGIWGLKYTIKSVSSGAVLIKRILRCDILAVAVLFGLIYLFGKFYYSRTIVFGTITLSIGLEIFLFVGIYYAFRFNQENKAHATAKLVTESPALEESQSQKFFLDSGNAIPPISNTSYIPPYSCEPDESILVSLWQRYLSDQEEVFSFVNDYLDLTRFCKSKTLVLQSETYFNIQNEDPGSRQIFINLHRINDFRRINLYLIKVNEMLMDGGVFICQGQTISQRRNQLYKRYTPYLGAPLYFVDFIVRRVFPKLPILQGWYFALTKGKNRALSETEMLGRFYFCGFELIHKKEINSTMHFILRKAKPPRNDPNPTYGPLIKLKRVGKDGKTIYIKKFRTMHPYSEYLQEYVYQTNALQDGGKFRDDFRVTEWGKVMRAMWIDELPQFINFFRGEVSLVGVRALSEHYFSLYPEDMKELRLKVKPGLLPPFYADLPTTFEEIVDSERRYIQSKMRHPLRTDWRYFWRSVWNILIKRARSN